MYQYIGALTVGGLTIVTVKIVGAVAIHGVGPNV